MKQDLEKYPRGMRPLLPGERRMPLDWPSGSSSEANRLRAMSRAELFDGRRVIDEDMAGCVVAGLWLYHDGFEESHGLSQDIHTPTGSYWHGILHRREPDYGNGKYWFRRVGSHAIYPALHAAAAPLLGKAMGGTWDPFAFIDLCERANRGDARLRDVCEQVQMIEWWLLLDYSLEAALGK